MARKARAALAAAVDVARPRVQAVVRERAGAAADALAPGFAPRYRRALRGAGAVTVTERAVAITISDPLVVAVERGASGFDMKPRLLARGKVSKGGSVYVDVQLRHAAGTVPQATRTAGRRAARQFGGVGEVRFSANTAGRSFTRALHRGPISQALGVGPRAQSVKHKRGVRDDLVRTATHGRGGGLSVRYSTFRRISTRSAASAWWHPGFKARRALDGVLPGAAREIADIIRAALAARAGR